MKNAFGAYPLYQPGLISPEKSLAGILPGNVFKKGNVGVISRSGTLTYEIVYHLTANGMGQSTAIGMEISGMWIFLI